MDQEQVSFFRRQLELQRRTYPRNSNEVAAAELVYEGALRDAVAHGVPGISGSDVRLDESVRVVFCCDGVNVTARFYNGEQRVGRSKVFTSEEAVAVGKRMAETGIYEEFPIGYVGIDRLRFFGMKLKEYGESCRNA